MVRLYFHLDRGMRKFPVAGILRCYVYVTAMGSARIHTRKLIANECKSESFSLYFDQSDEAVIRYMYGTVLKMKSFVVCVLVVAGRKNMHDKSSVRQR